MIMTVSVVFIVPACGTAKRIEDFKDEPYDEFNGTWIEKDEIDMDMSLEEC